MEGHVTDPHPPAPSRRSRPIAVAVCALTLVGAVLAGCSSEASSGASPAPDAAGSSVVVPDAATVIDVRTPQEYAEGHLEGAVNLDVQSDRFEQDLAALDPAGTYFVYCRSGNRSAAAVATMEAAGFTAVIDLGGLQDAADSTGIAVVR